MPDEVKPWVYELPEPDGDEQQIVLGRLYGWRIYVVPPAASLEKLERLKALQFDVRPLFAGTLFTPTKSTQVEGIETRAECVGALVNNAKPTHMAPAEGCNCGIHGYANVRNLMTQEKTYCNDPERTVYGLISVWGKVILRDTGFRAQFSRIERCFTSAPEEVRNSIAEIYGVPVHHRTQIDTMKLPGKETSIDLRGQVIPRSEVPPEDLLPFSSLEEQMSQPDS